MRLKVIIFSVAVLIAGAIMALNYFSKNGHQKVSQLQQEVNRLEKEQQALKDQLQGLEMQIEALKSGGKYRAKTIRDELGYVRDDEVVVDLGGAAQ